MFKCSQTIEKGVKEIESFRYLGINDFFSKLYTSNFIYKIKFLRGHA